MNETKIPVPRTEQRFTETVTRLLQSAGFCPTAPQEHLMECQRQTYRVEIKYSRTRLFPEGSARSIYHFLEVQSKNNSSIPLVVIGGEVSPSLRKEISEAAPGILVLDIQNLLYLAAGNRELYDELTALLPYSVSGLTPKSPDFRTSPGSPSDIPKNRGDGFSDPFSRYDDPRGHLVARPGTGKSDTLRRLAESTKAPGSEDLQNELTQWQGGKGTALSIQYEKLCTKVLKHLFSGDLSLWQEQARSNDELYRFDLICKLKRDNRKDFWETAERHFRSKYIIFEFKNYSGMVTQMEVTTTARYLYTKALRAVAIIVSPNGFSEHADKAARGSLREDGKLILPLTNAELVEMLRMQEHGDDPADYLSDKLDALLIDLEK